MGRKYHSPEGRASSILKTCWPFPARKESISSCQYVFIDPGYLLDLSPSYFRVPLSYDARKSLPRSHLSRDLIFTNQNEPIRVSPSTRSCSLPHGIILPFSWDVQLKL